jgi:hypothetical protein
VDFPFQRFDALGLLHETRQHAPLVHEPAGYSTEELIEPFEIGLLHPPGVEYGPEIVRSNGHGRS